MKRLLAYLFIVLGFGLTFSVNSEAGIIPYEPKANQIILINSNTNQILYEKNADQKINPAGFTKIMTSSFHSKQTTRSNVSW
jgi:D-alanyl-D-alanine carboxypeptidase (penicillin-binding protein 5/6)